MVKVSREFSAAELHQCEKRIYRKPRRFETLTYLLLLAICCCSVSPVFPVKGITKMNELGS